jgi:methyl-accepting chemotaxis protein
MDSRMKVSTRLALAFGALVALMLVVAGLGLASLGALNQQVDTLANNRAPQLIAAGRWEAAVLHTARHMSNALLLPAESARDELKAIHANKVQRTQLYEKMKTLVTDDRGMALLQNIVDVRKPYIDAENDRKSFSASM